MPGGDGTGPLGLGPMTGRAAGYCVGFGFPGYATPFYGHGFWGGGRGRAGGRGRRHWLYAPGFAGWSPFLMGGSAVAPPWPAASYGSPFVSAMTRQQEIDALKGQAEYVEDVLDGLRHRIEELEPKSAQA
jgi:Family of unknown function (DUF5320)